MTRRRGPETELLHQVKDYLSLRGCLVMRSNSGVLPNPAGRPVRFGSPGHPDLYGVLPAHVVRATGFRWAAGRAFFLEGKAGRNQPTALQTATLAGLERAGAAVAVCRSIDDVEAWLNDLGIR